MRYSVLENPRKRCHGTRKRDLMRVVLVAGAFPPAICGVGDYTRRLEIALTSAGVQVEIVTGRDCSLKNVHALVRSLRHEPLVHIQHPTARYDLHLGPQVLSLAVPPVVTIHEFSRFRLLDRLRACLFFARSRHLVFTSQDERDAACRRAPWIQAKSSVIPVGSTIRTIEGTVARSTGKILYFGLIAPGKGIESVLKLAALIRAGQLPYKVHIVGAVPDKLEEYARWLQSASLQLPIQWTLNQSEQKVAEILSESAVAYLPFPDGASDRRTSLKAVLEAGLACITTAGTQTSESLRRAVRTADRPEEALTIFRQLDASMETRQSLVREAHEYVKSHSWEIIVRSHINLYTRLMETNGR